MEIFILIGIVLAGLVLLLWYRSNKNTKVTVEASADPVTVETAPYKVPDPPAVTTLPLVVEETTTMAPMAVVEPVTVVEEILAIVEEPPAVEKPAAKPKRAKVNGKFVKDDPATPENEAWEGGVAPPKKPKAPPKSKRTRKPKA
jgi:hypothetical protein